MTKVTFKLVRAGRAERRCSANPDLYPYETVWTILVKGREIGELRRKSWINAEGGFAEWSAAFEAPQSWVEPQNIPDDSSLADAMRFVQAHYTANA